MNEHPKPTYLYIASPYTHPSRHIMKARYRNVMHYTALLLQDRRWAYSSIVHCHKMAKKHNLPVDFAYWSDYNEAMLANSAGLHVLCLDGWRASLGVAQEIKLAGVYGLPVIYVNPEWISESDAPDPDS